MAFSSWNNSIFVDYNKDVNGNILPQRIQNEYIVVQSESCGCTSQIPYTKNKIIIDGFQEVYDQDIISEKQFKVIYGESSLVFFHPSQIGKSILIKEYYGIGQCLIDINRIMMGLNSSGKPIKPFDVIKEAIKDYNNNVKNDYDNRLKPDYQINIKDYFENNVKKYFLDNIKNPWIDILLPQINKVISDYINATNPTWITNANWTKTITVDNTNIFQLELSSFNPVGDQVSKFAYQSAGQEGAIELIEGEHWTRIGATINLLKGLVFMKGDKVFINVYRGMAVTPIAGTNGGDLQNKSVSESKLSQDVQDKLNTVYYENTLNFVATVNNTTQFTIADSTFNPETDTLKVYQDNMLIRKDDNYTLNGMIVTLAEALNIGDKIYYEIGKNTVSNITNYLADGSLIGDGGVSKKKLTKDIQDELDLIPQINEQLADIERKKKDSVIRVDDYEGTDTEKIIQALADGENKTVLFGSGKTYIINQDFILPYGCDLRGRNAIVINEITNSKAVFTINKSNCKMNRLTIQNTDKNVGIDNNVTQSIFGSAVVVGGVYNKDTIHNTKISSIRVKNGIDGVSAIIGFGNIENIDIENCIIDGEHLVVDKGFIAGIHFEWNSNPVLSCKNVNVKNCRVTNMKKPSSHALYISGVINATVKNVICENVVNGILTYIGDKNVEGDTVGSHLIENCVVDTFKGYGFICKGCNTDLSIIRKTKTIFRNNNARNGLYTGFRIYRNDGCIILENNNVINCSNGVVVDPCNNIKIDNNIFENINEQAIIMLTVINSIICNNKFKNICKNGITTDAINSTIYMQVGCVNNLITNNTFGSSDHVFKPRFNIYIKSDATNKCTNNRIIGNTFYDTIGGSSVINGSSADNFTMCNYANSNIIIGSDILWSGGCIYNQEGNKKISYHILYPTLGTWSVGDIIYNTTPTAGGYIGWNCIVSGTPGVWKGFGLIQA